MAQEVCTPLHLSETVR